MMKMKMEVFYIVIFITLYKKDFKLSHYKYFVIYINSRTNTIQLLLLKLKKIQIQKLLVCNLERNCPYTGGGGSGHYKFKYT